ncbi:hypothetical protein NPIL_124511 [Nephila pilipes]|uniref:Uncharacterized protein n=1 Tax=Nephila pilipes TaxID=299642 RepID=A0A8X6Q098_NEPPI|nr:hypothetical protein NPIL_124511 [Nephila pilipes]
MLRSGVYCGDACWVKTAKKPATRQRCSERLNKCGTIQAVNLTLGLKLRGLILRAFQYISVSVLGQTPGPKPSPLNLALHEFEAISAVLQEKVALQALLPDFTGSLKYLEIVL